MLTRQKIPTNWIDREHLRIRGQFWTPDWVAEAMVGYLVAGGATCLFDPAVGAGAFFLAAKRLAAVTGHVLRLRGTEIDPEALQQARHWGVSGEDLAEVQIRDFVLDPPAGTLAALVANPPYIRHHRLTSETKARLRAICQEITGFTIDGRAGLHVYFLLRGLSLLEQGGRLAFIMPADTVEGVFAPKLWAWIARQYCLDAVITFAPEASPFPGVDTNAIVFLLRRAALEPTFRWIRCQAEHPDHLKEWTLSGFAVPAGATLDVHTRTLAEGLATGLSRVPANKSAGDATLGQYARVMRGVATGANAFFFLTRCQVQHLAIPAAFLHSALGRTRDAPADEITQQTLDAADRAGRPTLLFAPDGRALADFPLAVQVYLAEGVRSGLPERALIRQRRPWYKMETRAVPPFLFAYLGRRNARFIRNTAGVLPLTSFLCVYPHCRDEEHIEDLWALLSHPDTVGNLGRVGKSYGGGAIKVEPRALESLPIPRSAMGRLALHGIERLEARYPDSNS